MTKVSTFSARCLQCGNKFENPLLPDMSYGQFIARGKNGTEFAFLNSIENEAWNSAKKIYQELVSPLDDPDQEAERFQWLVSNLIDPLNSTELDITRSPICPKCQSDRVWYNDNNRIGSIEMSEVTFNNYLELSNEEKKNKIRILLKKLGNEFT